MQSRSLDERVSHQKSKDLWAVPAVFRALGRTIRYINVPPPIWEANLREAQLPPHLIAHLLAMGQLNRVNRFDRMTDAFQRLVGRAPISAAEFARRHAAVFTPG